VASVDELPRKQPGFDAVVSGLVLNFIPDPVVAVAAMVERLRQGGMLAGYVWDYSEGMQFIKRFWEIAAELDPKAAELDEGPRFPLCHTPALVALLEGAGLERVQTYALEIATHFPNFDDYWAPFLGGTGSAPTYVATLDPPAQEALRLRLRQRLSPNGDGPIRLTGRAWAVRGYRGSW
jgi:SAM-dependent methyltransferase